MSRNENALGRAGSDVFPGSQWRCFHLGIDNVVGASEHIGTERVAKSPPDGYTTPFNTIGPIAVNVSLFGKLPFDPLKDFAPVTRVALTPNIACLHPSLPATNVRNGAGSTQTPGPFLITFAFID